MINHAKLQNIPAELQSVPHWIAWKLISGDDGEKPKKLPIDPHTGQAAKTNDPATWADFATAVRGAQKYLCTGIGFVFSADDGFVGVDIDHCVDPDGNLNDTADAILQKQPTYTEYSPSGTGLHLWYRGEKPAGASKNAGTGVEMYDTGRYFTVTGSAFPDMPRTVETAKPETLAWIQQTYIGFPKPQAPEPGKAPASAVADAPELTDKEIIKKAKKAKNGETFTALYGGDWSSLAESQSEADLALCKMLAFWTGKDPDQIDRIFRGSKLMRIKWDQSHYGDGTTYGQATISKAIKTTNEVYTKPDNTSVYEHGGTYRRTKDGSSYQITNFIVEPLEKICAEDHTQYSAVFRNDRDQSFRLEFLSEDFESLKKFKHILNSKTIELSFFGSENDFEYLKSYLSQKEWKTIVGVEAAGICEHNNRLVYVSADGCTDADGNAVEDIVQIGKSVDIRSNILDAQLLDAGTLREMGKSLFGYNIPEKTVPILGWTAACFLKGILKQSRVKFPHLFLIGEAGSGKSTTLEHIILPIFSMDTVLAATQVTPFTLLHGSASSTLFPLAYDEYKPSKMGHTKLNTMSCFLRDAYDNHDSRRGQANLTINAYRYRSPVIVVGEESSSETAINERSVKLLFSKRDLTKENLEVLEKLTGTAFLHDFGRTLLHAALSVSAEQVMDWYRQGKQLFDGGLDARIHSNLAVCHCGLQLVKALCTSYGLTWDDVFPVSMAECDQILQKSAVDYLLGGSLRSRSVVDQTLDVILRMPLEKGIDYMVEKDVLYLRLNTVYDKYTEYRRTHDIQNEVLTLSEFQLQLEHSDLFVAKSEQRRCGSKNYRYWGLRLDILQERCDTSAIEGITAAPLVSAPEKNKTTERVSQ